MWSVRLSDAQRDALRGLIEAQGVVGPTLTTACEALELARWDDLPEATLPWDRVCELAEKQGIGEADVVWDLAAGMPPAPPRRRVGRKAALAKRAKPPA